MGHTDFLATLTMSLPRLGASLLTVPTDSKLEFIVSEDMTESGLNDKIVINTDLIITESSQKISNTRLTDAHGLEK